METYGLVTGVEHSGSVQLRLGNPRMSSGVGLGSNFMNRELELRSSECSRVEEFGVKQLPVKRRDRLIIAHSLIK